MSSDIGKTTAADYDPAVDLPDVQEDLEKIAGHGVSAVNWGWYQQGYEHEVSGLSGKASHGGYVAHHNAPQYFGYVANNPLATKHLHGLSEFFDDVAAKWLPSSRVFYVRGGYGSIEGWQPQDPNPNLAKVFNGNDDHPGYSDSQISEALLAKEINDIAGSPYWSDSAIIITYEMTSPSLRTFNSIDASTYRGYSESNGKLLCAAHWGLLHMFPLSRAPLPLPCSMTF
jgi:phospholipase C